MDEGSEAWDALADHVAAFLAAWEADCDPPELTRFLPAHPPALRRMVLVELIKIDLEQRVLGRGPPRPIEQYASDFPEILGGEGLPCDLIYEEYYARQQAGEPVSQEEYLKRFPGQARSLGRLFGLGSTRVVKGTVHGPASIDIQPGRSIDDFEVLSVLGEGAFAKVFLARQHSMQRLVALKISARRSDEPQTMAQLDHASIVRVYDQRQLPDRDLQLVYMEYVPGGSLQAVVDRVRRTPPSLRSGAILADAVDQALAAHGEPAMSGPCRERLARLTWGETVCWLGVQIASALDCAHSRDTLHRDLKPANVLLSAEGIPKLVDFNMSYNSKLEGASPASYFGGSLGYMAPEHLEAYSPYHDRRPADLDGRCDLYALGLVLWEVLTGARPFSEEIIEDDWEATVCEMIARRSSGLPPSAFEQLPRDIPLGLREALARCLHPDPACRFLTAGEMARELSLCLQPEVCHARQRRMGRWYAAARRRPLLAVTLVGLLPNLILSVANVSYDLFAIVLPRLPPKAHGVFLGTLITLDKGVLYAVGLAIGLALAWPALVPLWSPPTMLELIRAPTAQPPVGRPGLRGQPGCLGIVGRALPRVARLASRGHHRQRLSPLLRLAPALRLDRRNLGVLPHVAPGKPRLLSQPLGDGAARGKRRRRTAGASRACPRIRAWPWWCPSWRR